MDLVNSILLIIVSFLLGLVFVKYLTVHPLKMSFYLILSCIAFFLIFLIIVTSFTGDFAFVFIQIIVSTISFSSGYWLMAKSVLSVQDNNTIPAITQTKNGFENNHMAIVYFAHGEPETYNPIGWISQFKEFDDQKVPFIPFFARPLFLYKLRKKYMQIGKSDHRKMHQIMLNDLEKSFQMDGDKETKFYLSFLDDEPHPDNAVIQAIKEGAKHIIVCEIFVSLSSHTSEGEELINNLNPLEYGVQLHFTKPLWDSAILHRMFIERAREKIDGIDKSKVGILLVGHGQPDEWDTLFPTATEHENHFREKIMNLFIKDGYCKENIALAWMEFKEPKPKTIIEEFVRNGVELILYFATSISADAIHSMYDIPSLVHEANVSKNVELVNMGAWNNHPLVIESIKERVDFVIQKIKKEQSLRLEVTNL